MISLPYLRYYFGGVKVEECLLIWSHLMKIEVGETGVDVGLNLLEVLVYVDTADDCLVDLRQSYRRG